MAARPPRVRQRVDRDGVTTTDAAGIRTSIWLLALAVALVGIAVFVVVHPAWQQRAADDTSAQVAQHVADTPRVPAARRPPQPPPAVAEPPHDTDASDGDAGRRHAAPTAQSDRHASGSPEPNAAAHAPVGIALFPPPGTKPIKRGIIVPEGVELPPGYVRHYQTTDDGHQLPPILMFHPDYQPLDERGHPIELTDDRLVPADMVPPGMPVEMLEVPEDGPPPEGQPGRPRDDAPTR